MRLFGVNKKKSINQSDHNKTANPTKRLLSYQFANMQGIGRRNRQEDAFSQMNVMDVKKIRKEGILFVICDGMGGMADGKMASETAVRSIRASFLEIAAKKILQNNSRMQCLRQEVPCIGNLEGPAAQRL